MVLRAQADRRWSRERMMPFHDRPSRVQRSSKHRPGCIHQKWFITAIKATYLFCSSLPTRSNTLSPVNSSQTVCRIADFPTPTGPLIHMILLSDPNPFLPIQLFTTFFAAMRVSGWQCGAGYRSAELRSAPDATFDSSVNGWSTHNQGRNATEGEEMLTADAHKMGNRDIRHISDVVEVATGNVAVTSDSEVPLVDHRYATRSRW